MIFRDMRYNLNTFIQLVRAHYFLPRVKNVRLFVVSSQFHRIFKQRERYRVGFTISKRHAFTLFFSTRPKISPFRHWRPGHSIQGWTHFRRDDSPITIRFHWLIYRTYTGLTRVLHNYASFDPLSMNSYVRLYLNRIE